MTNFCVVRREYVNHTLVDEAVFDGFDSASETQARANAEDASRAYQFFGYDEAGGYWWGKNTGSNEFRFTVEPEGSLVTAKTV